MRLVLSVAPLAAVRADRCRLLRDAAAAVGPPGKRNAAVDQQLRSR